MTYRVTIRASAVDDAIVDAPFTTYEADFATQTEANQFALRTVEQLTNEGRSVFSCTVCYDPRGYALPRFTWFDA